MNSFAAMLVLLFGTSCGLVAEAAGEEPPGKPSPLVLAEVSEMTDHAGAIRVTCIVRESLLAESDLSTREFSYDFLAEAPQCKIGSRVIWAVDVKEDGSLVPYSEGTRWERVALVVPVWDTSTAFNPIVRLVRMIAEFRKLRPPDRVPFLIAQTKSDEESIGEWALAELAEVLGGEAGNTIRAIASSGDYPARVRLRADAYYLKGDAEWRETKSRLAMLEDCTKEGRPEAIVRMSLSSIANWLRNDRAQRAWYRALLMKMLRDPGLHMELREEVVRVLAEVQDDKQEQEEFRTLLEDLLQGDWPIQLKTCAVNHIAAARSLGGKDRIDWWLRLVRSHATIEVRCWAMRYIADSAAKDPRTLQEVTRLYREGDWMRSEALHYLYSRKFSKDEIAAVRKQIEITDSEVVREALREFLEKRETLDK